MFTIDQISDTHLGHGTTLFRRNFDRMATALTADPPDLIVVSGDLSLDGADSDADMAYAAARLAELPRPILAVPGNHDVGDHPERAPRQPFASARLARFQRHFGAGRWQVDREGWRILGLNSQVAGTGHAEEEAQAGFIEEAVASLGDRHLAVFLHKPIFTTTPEDSLFDYWSVPPFAREPFLPLLEHPALRLVGSGHLHLHREFARGTARFVWAPSVAFVVAEEEQAGLPGGRPCGWLLHRFGPVAVDTALVSPEAMERPFIHEVRAEAYPHSSLLPAVADAG